MEQRTIQLSVRELVEYAYRSGDLTFGFRAASALTQGTKIHQAVQAEYGEMDEKELYLSAEIPFESFLFLIDGRCDGLLQTDQGVMIDEIKSTSGMLPNSAEESPEVHWAQAICYGYMYAFKMELDSMLVRLTYVSVATGERRAFVRRLTVAELAAEMHDAVNAYFPYAELRYAHAQRRAASAQALSFLLRRIGRASASSREQFIKRYQMDLSCSPRRQRALARPFQRFFPQLRRWAKGVWTILSI